MALGKKDLVLIFLSIMTGLAAVFWESLEKSLLNLHGNILASSMEHMFPEGSTCPLGYGPSTSGKNKKMLNPHMGPKSTAAVLYTNGVILTSDAANPYASSFVVEDGKFSNIYYSESKPDLPYTSVVDLNGSLVTPGLVDPHIHLLSGGMSLRALNLKNTSAGDMIDLIQKAASHLPKGSWIVGFGYDHPDDFPHRRVLDVVSPEHPVVVYKFDAHQILANSVALRIANISKGTSSPAGGSIIRDAEGDPNGVLTDAAITLVTRSMPEEDEQTLKEALMLAQKYALSKGVTSVHDMGRVAFQYNESTAFLDLVNVLLPAARSMELKLRVSSFVPLSMWRSLVELMRVMGNEENRLSFGSVKEFYDGSLGSKTALMNEEYGDDPGNQGMVTITDYDAFVGNVKQAHKAGLQIAIHAIGNKAVDEVIEVYKNHACEQHTTTCSKVRHRIEHAQHVTGIDSIRQLSSLGIPVTPNPMHLPGDMKILESRMNNTKDAALYAYPFQKFVENRVKIGFASDWPVVDLDPWGSLLVATNASQSGRNAVSFQDALYAITRGAVEVEDRPHQNTGQISTGMEADFVIHSSEYNSSMDIMGSLASRAAKLIQSRNGVNKTYVAGECVFGCSI